MPTPPRAPARSSGDFYPPGLRRHFAWLLSACLLLVCLTLHAEEPAVQLPAFRARASDLYFHIHFLKNTDEVIEIRVADVKRGSPAEKLGIREGDSMVTVGGAPVAGRKRHEFVGPQDRLVLKGQLGFTGHRGLFRKAWSLAVDSTVLWPKPTPPPAPSPTPAPTSAPAELPRP